MEGEPLTTFLCLSFPLSDSLKYSVFLLFFIFLFVFCSFLFFLFAFLKFTFFLSFCPPPPQISHCQAKTCEEHEEHEEHEAELMTSRRSLKTNIPLALIVYCLWSRFFFLVYQIKPFKILFCLNEFRGRVSMCPCFRQCTKKQSLAFLYLSGE